MSFQVTAPLQVDMRQEETQTTRLYHDHADQQSIGVSHQHQEEESGSDFFYWAIPANSINPYQKIIVCSTYYCETYRINCIRVSIGLLLLKNKVGEVEKPSFGSLM